MKAILVKDCAECPLSDIWANGKVWCESTSSHIKLASPKDRQVGIIDNAPIPNWCPLTDAEEQFTEFSFNKKSTVEAKTGEKKQ